MVARLIALALMLTLLAAPGLAQADDAPTLTTADIAVTTNVVFGAAGVAFVNDQSAPCLLIHGGKDTTLPAEQSQRMAAALQAAEVEVVYAFLPAATHITIPSWALSGALTLAFLGRHMHPER